MTAILIFFSGLIGTGSSAKADWLNLTGAETSPNIAEIRILDDRVQIALEVYVRDIPVFEDLVPDEWLKDGAVSRPPLAERLARFSNEMLQIITDDGVKLPAQLTLVERRLRKDRYSPFAGMVNPMTRRRAPEAPKDKRVLYAELEYPFSGRPDTLTIAPPLPKEGRARASIGFIAYHKAVPIIDFRFLSASAKLNLDWQDPWYSAFENPNLKRHHKWPIMSFLYIEPREVRHEAIVRIKDLQGWMELGLEDEKLVSPADQIRIRDLAGSFFMTRNPVTINGKSATPVSYRAEFLELSLTGVQVVEGERNLEPATANLGIILSYPVAHIPREVTAKWELFNERIDQVSATSTDPAGPFPNVVTVADPVHVWQNHLLKYKEPVVKPVPVDGTRKIAIPVLSVLFAFAALAALYLAIRPRLASRAVWIGVLVVCFVASVLAMPAAVISISNPIAGLPGKEESGTVIGEVLNNANAAFQEIDPAAIERELAVFVDADEIDAVRTELDRALVIRIAGGTTARVSAVDNIDVTEIGKLDGGSGFRAVAGWTAAASAGHWGHAHRRTIEYRAIMELAEIDNVWKLAGITIVDAKQVQ